LPVEPAPPGAWSPALRQLAQASKRWVAPPAWWHNDVRYVGRVESLAAGAKYDWDGLKRPGSENSPIFCCHFTLAGWGSFQVGGQLPERIEPGMGFIARVPSEHRFYLPRESPGWTHAWLIVAHPYLVARFSERVAASGPIVRFDAKSAFLARALSLICSSYKKDIRDRFEVERALFQFLVDYERHVHEQHDPSGERGRLLQAVTERVLANPKLIPNVDALAAEYGMTRTNFSHFFRSRTGLTPARVILQARLEQAARLLTDTDERVKDIAEACGFANANHFIRAFHQRMHVSPGEYRRTLLRTSFHE
jgi:AraC-like DNA-binding protein